MLFVIKKYSRIFLMIIVFISNISKVHSDPLPQLGDPYSGVLPISNEEIIGFMSYQSLQNRNYIINDPLVVSYINYLGNLLSRITSTLFSTIFINSLFLPLSGSLIFTL